MRWWKKAFGVDLFDTIVHVAITFLLLVVVEAKTHESASMIALTIASTVLFSFRRHFALRKAALAGEVSGETTTGVHRRLDQEARMQELETLYGRVAELEERVDFAERLLAHRDEPAKLEAPRA